MPDRPRVIVTRRLPDAVEAELSRRFDAVLNPSDRRFDAASMVDALQNADGLLCAMGDPMDEATLSQATRAKMLANFAVGVNHVDLDAARAHGLSVSNTPGVLTDATADIALTLILMTLRRAAEGERLARSGAWTGWTPTQLLGRDLGGRTLGIVGMGRIGRATARRAAAFGMRILYTNRSDIDPGLPAERRELPDLMAQADVISLHCPGSAENRGLISADLIGRMKPEAYLINTARGDVVDEPALIRALETRAIAGAGLDVFAKEPRIPDALRALDNVTLLPHLGSATEETRIAMGMKCVENLSAHFEGRPLPDRVV